MKNRHALPVTFVAISSLVLTLGGYLLTTKTTLHPQFFITACGEVLRNIQEHVHFNPDGVMSSLILFVTAISVSLALFQLIRFIFSHGRLHQFQKEEILSGNLRAIISKQNLSSDSVAVIKNNKLTAYTIGLFKPKIIVSKALIVNLSQEQLEAVVLHELYHLRSRHLLWLLLSRLISSLFFFIPLVEYLAQQLKTEFELAADAFVVEKQKTRDHLCGSLALNIKYAGGVIPHFATSPIEKRVESLLSHKVSFDKISIMRFSLSLFSITIMIGLALAQPNQIAAGFHNDSEAVCKIGDKCRNKDCSNQSNIDKQFFSASVPASFSLSSSY